MTRGSENPNGSDDRDYGGFVFGAGWSTTDDDDDSGVRGALSSIVVVVVVVGLLAAGVYPYVLFADPTNLQQIGAQPDEDGPASGTDESISDPQNDTTTVASTDETPIEESTGRESATTERRASTENSEATIESATDTEPTATDSEPANSGSTATPTPVITKGSTTVTDTAVPSTTDEPTTDGIESRSPSIGVFRVDDVSGDETGGTDDIDVFDVEWHVSDPDGDLRTVRVSLVGNPDDDAQSIERRTVTVDGSEASGTTTFAVEGDESGAAYEIQITVEDEAGNVVLRTTREVAE